MTNSLLIPHSFKRVGWCFLIIAVVLWIALMLLPVNHPELLKVSMFSIWNSENFGRRYFTIITNDFSDELISLLFIAGGLVVAFSKEKTEDEFIGNLRLTSLLWAVLLNYILLIVCILFIYDMPFLNVMMYNMFTILILFIARFHYKMYRSSLNK